MGWVRSGPPHSSCPPSWPSCSRPPGSVASMARSTRSTSRAIGPRRGSRSTRGRELCWRFRGIDIWPSVRPMGGRSTTRSPSTSVATSSSPPTSASVHRLRSVQIPATAASGGHSRSCGRPSPPATSSRAIGVRWIVLLHEADWTVLQSGLRDDPGLTLQLDGPALSLFEVDDWRSVVTDGGSTVSSNHVLPPLLRLDASGEATWSQPVRGRLVPRSGRSPAQPLGSRRLAGGPRARVVLASSRRRVRRCARRRRRSDRGARSHPQTGPPRPRSFERTSLTHCA